MWKFLYRYFTRKKFLCTILNTFETVCYTWNVRPLFDISKYAIAPTQTPLPQILGLQFSQCLKADAIFFVYFTARRLRFQMKFSNMACLRDFIALQVAACVHVIRAGGLTSWVLYEKNLLFTVIGKKNYINIIKEIQREKCTIVFSLRSLFRLAVPGHVKFSMSSGTRNAIIVSLSSTC